MQYKLLGNSGLRVSEISLGTMTFGTKWGWGADKETSKQILNQYTEAGGNFIDTSCNYTDGESESFIGEFIKGDRDRYVIATKFTLHDYRYKKDPNAAGNHRKNLIRSLKGSLERLQTDYVDILYLHMWDYMTPVQEIMRTLNDLIATTKVNYIGISDTPAWIVSRANTMAEIRGWNPFVVYQFPYSLAFRDAEREVIPLCKKMDLAMATFDVLGAGLLTGKYTRQESPYGRLQPGKWGTPPDIALEIAREVDAIADELECPSSHVAIAWIRGQEGLFTPILGTTKVQQIEENLNGLDVKLTDDYYQRLEEKVREKLRFNFGFAKGWLMGARSVLYGETYDLIDNHRKYE
ncbi:MAG: aldo/keto reductase [Candidatus Heimdallarchaeota archaeon]